MKRELAEKALHDLQKIEDLVVQGPQSAESRVGVLSFNMQGTFPHQLATWLDAEYGIAIRAGHHCAQPAHQALGVQTTARASFYIYNDRQDVEKLAEALREFQTSL